MREGSLAPTLTAATSVEWLAAPVALFRGQPWAVAATKEREEERSGEREFAVEAFVAV